MVTKITNQTQRIGEVISASITGLTAEAIQEQGSDGLPESMRPCFGSFVKAESTGNKNIVAIVYDVITGSPDNSHKPSAFGMSREQLKKEQPHIFALLRTEIHAVVIGYFDQGQFFSHLPPYPVQVHDLLYNCSAEEVRAATVNLDFLRLVLGVATVPVDELMAATIREASLTWDNKQQFLIKAGQALSELFSADYDRLLAVLRKVKIKN